MDETRGEKQMDETRCKKHVYPQERWGSFHGHQCHRKVWKDGFCRQHHPETEETRTIEAQKRWQEKHDNDPLRVTLRRVKKLEVVLKDAYELITERWGYPDDASSRATIVQLMKDVLEGK